MALSIAAQTHSVSWQQVTRKIVSGDPLEVLDQLEAAARLAERDNDVALRTALSASALAFMIVDWSRFTDWPTWIQRFAESDALPSADSDASLNLARATGAMARALLRGEPNEILAPLGQHLESLLDTPCDSTQLALAAGTLLPWLQMSKNPAAAQALHGRMTAPHTERLLEPAGTQYLRGAWLGAWALHLHFTDKSRLPEALRVFDDYLAQVPSPRLHFRRARLATEQAMYEQDIDRAEQALRDLLSTVHARRPMERVIYNLVAASVAGAKNDADRAMLHMTHNVHDLDMADCPPSIAAVYRSAESRVYLAHREYAKAAELEEQFAEGAHTPHAAVNRGSAHLARALLAHQDGAQSPEALREHLQVGLSAMRGMPAVNFFFTTPEARASVCALALREGIETEFVQSSLKRFPVPPPEWADEHWPWAMSLRCFGGFRSVGLAVDGRASSKASNRPLSLLMLIAAHGAQGVPVASATDALWPDQDGDQAENSLSVTLLRLRRRFSEADLIERRGGWLHLNPVRVWTDVAALEAHLDATNASATAAAASESVRMQHISRMFDLYRGACLFGMDDEWAHRRATHYRGRVTTAAKQVLQDALRGEHGAAAELLLTSAVERRLDVARLVATVRVGLPASPMWAQLQQHVEMITATG